MAPISAKVPYSKSNKVSTSFFRLTLQTGQVNTVNSVDIQITWVSESYETGRLNINTSVEGRLKDPEGKFCEKWGGGELKPTITVFWA